MQYTESLFYSMQHINVENLFTTLGPISLFQKGSGENRVYSLPHPVLAEEQHAV